MEEVCAHSDRSLVARVARSSFRDGSTPFRLLGIPHRYAEAIEHHGVPEVTDLDVIADEFEVLDVSIVAGTT